MNKERIFLKKDQLPEVTMDEIMKMLEKNDNLIVHVEFERKEVEPDA